MFPTHAFRWTNQNLSSCQKCRQITKTYCEFVSKTLVFPDLVYKISQDSKHKKYHNYWCALTSSQWRPGKEQQ